MAIGILSRFYQLIIYKINSIHKFGRSFHTSSLILNNNKILNLISPLKTPKVVKKKIQLLQ
jgi:hypothetical protein